VFVEFDDMSAVERFLKADPKPTWEDKELLIMTKSAIPPCASDPVFFFTFNAGRSTAT